ncbi:MAG: GIY-YIG nuclease family protein [Thermoflavifilum sp.]|uniref:GIY-YIG nuclease family protein n=1 Tax=Thermoflavifilum sp. TaxID=1968839 RepID=UPI0018A4FC48|nr:GIY-YIG nuclease family protein [Thermoflavifilum sp.]QOR75789.1 MAG: GIY-YIG nuclease family protein [Thermoflavifilum sp.]
MFTVYVLYSPLHHKIYIGYTANLQQRLLAHNMLAHKGWTKRFRPWIVLLTESFPSKQQARIREKQLKSAKGRQFIWQLIHQYYPPHP